MDKSIVYPFFLECKNYTLDPYYVDILESCAKAKFPKGFKLTNDRTAIVNGQNGRQVYDLPIHHPTELWCSLRKIFREELQLRSSSEFILTKSDVKRSRSLTLEKLEGNSWKELKSKKIKDQVILDFVVGKQKEYNLETESAKDLIARLNLHLNVLRNISPEDIEYENGNIVNVKGLSFNKGRFQLSCDSPPRPERLNNPSRTQTAVEKYIKEVQIRQDYN